ncbi:hypothetical protein BD31_I1089 [Candidatus Nitrosopumilus salaria BD31]|uniref:Uncharacterized protein n=1 Tax=Candidatus Nitrosopumilus salarius BD31 TaxID=859350 RepID=I3D058_9ARCH|nr:hypothetical protein [Candidatus Nitrosopumilus salaria]EIJ65101.1 hypothetical protein BD31_I1089 [Candidatus Nitrosopumilus salaria BD31]
MLPDQCSVLEEGKQCVNPPEFIVSIISDKDEYMVGVTCQKHKQIVSGKVGILQSEGKIHDGKISFSPVKSVGTDCIHGDADDFIQIDMNSSKN